MTSRFRRRTLALSSLLALGIASAGASPAMAQPLATATERTHWSASHDFYNLPHFFSNVPGKVVRTEDFHGPITLPFGKNNTYPLKGRRVLYTSTQSDGKVAITSGALVEPSADYTGKAAEAPLIVLAPSTLGQGSQCAASRNVNTFLGLSVNNADGTSDTIDTVIREKRFDPSTLNMKNPVTMITDYEGFVSWTLIKRGYRVFVIDYMDGATGPQAYANNIEGGHAMLDAARAVKDMGIISEKTPIGFWGFSQGGGAAALGATLHRTYAPDVNLSASYIGSPPLDMMRVIDKIDGSILVGLAGFAFNGYAHRYPEVEALREQMINEKGKKILEQLSHECVTEVVDTAGFRNTKEFTKDGRGFKYHLTTNPAAHRLMSEQYSKALLTPDVPIMVVSNTNDDVVDYSQVLSTVHTWAAAGASVSFYNVLVGPILPGFAAAHMLPGFFSLDMAVDFLEARFSGEPAPATSFHVVKRTI